MKLPFHLSGSSIRDADGILIDRECQPFYPGEDKIRQMTIAGLRRFVEQNRGILRGKVLDFGCGRPGTCRVPEPYRDLVDGQYFGVDKDDVWPDEKDYQPGLDAILCTEVLCYLANPLLELGNLICRLRAGGHLLVTATAAWPEIEPTSLWRFTAAGLLQMAKQLNAPGIVEPIADMTIERNVFVLSHGMILTKAS